MAVSNTSSRKPLWIILGCFSVVLLANATLVYFALTSWTGLETEQHYVKGLTYNNNLEGAKRQQALGWQANLDAKFEDGENIAGTLQIEFVDRDGHSLSDLDVRVVTTRPTHDGYDQEFNVIHVGNGFYRGAFSLPLRGQWNFRILARRGDDDFQRVERIVTPN